MARYGFKKSGNASMSGGTTDSPMSLPDPGNPWDAPRSTPASTPQPFLTSSSSDDPFGDSQPSMSEQVNTNPFAGEGVRKAGAAIGEGAKFVGNLGAMGAKAVGRGVKNFNARRAASRAQAAQGYTEEGPDGAPQSQFNYGDQPLARPASSRAMKRGVSYTRGGGNYQSPRTYNINFGDDTVGGFSVGGDVIGGGSVKGNISGPRPGKGSGGNTNVGSGNQTIIQKGKGNQASTAGPSTTTTPATLPIMGPASPAGPTPPAGPKGGKPKSGGKKTPPKTTPAATATQSAPAAKKTAPKETTQGGSQSKTPPSSKPATSKKTSPKAKGGK
jgi:hypothetical protein